MAKTQIRTLNEDLDIVLSKYGLDGLELENAKEEVIHVCFEHLRRKLFKEENYGNKS